MIIKVHDDYKYGKNDAIGKWKHHITMGPKERPIERRKIDDRERNIVSLCPRHTC